jgi:2,4-diaminopentanoate dehydrogenase
MLRRRTRLIMYGLGAIGADIARLTLDHSALELVGAIDADPGKAGRDLGEALGRDALGVRVESDPARALRQARPDVAIIATTSFLREVFGPIRDCLATGTHVVSTCEELVYPAASHPDLAREIDEEARAAGVAVLGVGINPGFAMDLLPIMLTAPSTAIRHIAVQRVVDASTRRATLQQRIGAGLEPAMFREWLRQRTTPHVGLVHSLRMIADALGWQLDRIAEDARPIVADGWIRTGYVTVAPGQVAGIHQTARGFAGTREVIHLDWRTAVGMADTHDSIVIDGTPPLDVLIRGGIHGDQATAALVTRAASMVAGLPPGLRTVLDLPLLHYGLGRVGSRMAA